MMEDARICPNCKSGMDVVIGTVAEPSEAKFKCLACGFILNHIFPGGTKMATVPESDIMTYFAGDRTVIRPLKAWGVSNIAELKIKAKENCGKCHGRGYLGALTMPSGQKALLVCGCIIPAPVQPEAPDILREVGETIKNADAVLNALKGHQETLDGIIGVEAEGTCPSPPTTV